MFILRIISGNFRVPVGAVFARVDIVRGKLKLAPNTVFINIMSRRPTLQIRAERFVKLGVNWMFDSGGRRL